MSATADRVVTVDEERRARGDIGPCSHVSCDQRATWILSVDIKGIEVTAWTCDEHRALLRGVSQ